MTKHAHREKIVTAGHDDLLFFGSVTDFEPNLLLSMLKGVTWPDLLLYLLHFWGFSSESSHFDTIYTVQTTEIDRFLI
jgi:hypothetical protein